MSDRSQGLPRPAPGTRGVKNPDMPKEKTCNWPGAPGPKGPKMNRVGGFHEVKQSAKQDMADDIYGNGPAMMGDPVMMQPVPGVGQQVPPEMMPVDPISMMPGRPDPYRVPPIMRGPRIRPLPRIIPRGRGRGLNRIF